jgi:lipid-A-disaccharide synthase
MLSAGEASGDLHGSTLCRELRALDPSLRLVGMGGPRMGAAGVELLADPTRHAVVGGTEAMGRIPTLYRAYRSLTRRLRADAPRVLVLVDFPEFNMQLGRRARRARVPVVYFIPPQLWAWRRGRVRTIRSFATRVLAVLPFEATLYRDAGVPVEFVGHPLLDSLPLDLPRHVACQRLGVPAEERVVALLPGSRRDEVARLLPAMLEAAGRLARRARPPRFLLGLAPTVDRTQVLDLVRAAATTGPPSLQIVEGRTWELMRAADAGLTASGTATLEAALLGMPMVICYRMSPLSFTLAKRVVSTRWIGLPNIVSGRSVVPELVQGDVSGASLAAHAERLLDDDAVSGAQREAFGLVRQRLGEPGVGRRAARAILEVAPAA